MHLVGHHEVARAEAAQVEQQRAMPRRRRRDRRVRLLDAGRPRPPEVERYQHGQHAVAALAEERQHRLEVRRERRRIPVRAAHVVDADVQAAEVVAEVRADERQLRAHDVRRPRAVDREPRVRQPEPARHPQRPGLQRHAPLQLAAAVGDRVPEREDADAARRSQRTRKLRVVERPAPAAEDGTATTRYRPVARLRRCGPRTTTRAPRVPAVTAVERMRDQRQRRPVVHTCR